MHRPSLPGRIYMGAPGRQCEDCVRVGAASRAQVDRILKAKGNVTLESLQRAAAVVGRELRLELV